MKGRCVVIGYFVATSLLACGGTVDGEGGQQPPIPEAGRSSRGGASSGGASSGGASSAIATGLQAGALPMRDPNLPGVDFEDGSWIQLGSPTWSGSFTAGGASNAGNSGGAAGSDPSSPMPK